MPRELGAEQSLVVCEYVQTLTLRGLEKSKLYVETS